MPKVGPPFLALLQRNVGGQGGDGAAGPRFGGAALHPFPFPSRATGLQSSFLSLTWWLLRQEKSEQGAGDKWGGHLMQQQWLFGNATPVAMPTKSSVLIDLNLLRVTPNSHHHNHKAAEHLLKWSTASSAGTHATSDVTLLSLSTGSHCCFSFI